MKIGLIGAGKMGLSIALKLSKYHNVIVHDINIKRIDEAREKKLNCFLHLEEFVEALNSPKKIWLMVGHGMIVDNLLTKLIPFLTSKDIIIDAGNANFLDTIKRRHKLDRKQIGFLGSGTSGGVTSINEKLAICVDGPKWAYESVKDILIWFQKIILT